MCRVYRDLLESPSFYVGNTGIEYSYEEYLNHGYGGLYRYRKDLPHDEYPFSVKYECKIKSIHDCGEIDCEYKRNNNG